MKGVNWNSTKNEYSNIVNEDTQLKANKANLLRLKYNVSVRDIAYILDLSQSRIREYLREL